LIGNYLRLIPDGEYLSGIFYVATSLGVKALFTSEISEIFCETVCNVKDSNF